MKIYESLWKSYKIYENPWNSKKIFENSRFRMSDSGWLIKYSTTRLAISGSKPKLKSCEIYKFQGPAAEGVEDLMRRVWNSACGGCGTLACRGCGTSSHAEGLGLGLRRVRNSACEGSGALLAEGLELCLRRVWNSAIFIDFLGVPEEY